MNFSESYFAEVNEIVSGIRAADIERIVDIIVDTKNSGGRVFFIGVGGSAANCSHAVNDFRKILGVESYSPCDNVAELTARTNDDGWDTVFASWLSVSKLNRKDCIFVMSVGGGDIKKNISPNIVRALEFSKKIGARVVGIVGRDGGYTATVADACVIIPTVNPKNVTPHTEEFQAVVWHLLVSHPRLKENQTKWESTAG